MTTLANGASVTLTLGDYDSVTVHALGVATLTAVSGLGVPAGKLGDFTGTRTFGPFEAGQLTIAASVRNCQYEVADGVRPSASGGGGGSAATITGSYVVGQTLTAAFPGGGIGSIQFTRTLATAPFTKTAISGAAASAVNSLTYTLQAADAGYIPGVDSYQVVSAVGSLVPAPVNPAKSSGVVRLIGTQNQQVQPSALSGSFNSAVIKLQAPAAAIGARVAVVNNAPHFGMTGMKAAMASTEISACDTAANAYTPIIGGVAVNAISATTSDKGFVKATWGGASISRRLGKSNSILPGFGYNNQEEIVVSDIIPLVPVQATDRGSPENYYILRLTGVGQSGQDGQSQIEGGTGKVANVLYNEWLNTSGADSPLICIGGLGNTTDAVDGNIATIPGGIANGYSPVFHIEWIYPAGIVPVTFFHVGDSITEGYEWPRWAVNRKNTNRSRPLHHVNIGGSTTRTEAFLGEMYLHLQAMGKPDYVVMPIISVNNYSPLSSFTLANANTEYARLQEVAVFLAGLGIKIIWWVPFNFGANPAAGDLTSPWGFIYNSAKAYAAANSITFMDINGDSRLVRSVYNASTNPTGWIDPDNTHPSNPTGKAGFAQSYAEQLTALGF